MFPQALPDEDRLLLERLVRQCPELQQRATFCLDPDSTGRFYWRVTPGVGYRPHLTADQILNFIPLGSTWSQFKGRRSMTVVPAFSARDVTVLLGMERILMRTPRSYPVAFYWLFEAGEMRTQVPRTLTSLVPMLDTEEKESLGAALRSMETLGDRIVFARTNDFDPDQLDRVVDQFNAYDGTAPHTMIVVGPGAALGPEIFRTSASGGPKTRMEPEVRSRIDQCGPLGAMEGSPAESVPEPRRHFLGWWRRRGLQHLGTLLDLLRRRGRQGPTA